MYYGVHLKSLFVVFLLCIFFPGMDQEYADPIRKSHIDANVPPVDEFQDLMQRDLDEYFSKLLEKDIHVSFELLREKPSQSGVAYPKFYVWVRLMEYGRLLDVGAVQVAAIEQSQFEVIRYLNADQIRRDPEALQNTFPEDVCQKIRTKMGSLLIGWPSKFIETAVGMEFSVCKPDFYITISEENKNSPISAKPKTEAADECRMDGYQAIYIASSKIPYSNQVSPVSAIVSYYNAINLRDFRRASSYLVKPPKGAAWSFWAKGYATTSHVDLYILWKPGMEQEVPPSWLYVEIPVILISYEVTGQRVDYHGSYMLIKNEVENPSWKIQEGHFRDSHSLFPIAREGLDPVNERLLNPFRRRVVPPAHQERQDKSLVQFLDTLKMNLANRNSDYLLSIIDEHAKCSIDDDSCPKVMELDRNPDSSFVWQEIERLLSYGAIETSEHSYLFPSWSGEDWEPDPKEDPYEFEYLWVSGSEVAFRATPGGEVIDRKSYEIVRFADNNRSGEWTRVVDSKGRTGYMATRYLRSSSDYILVVKKVDGKWKIISFLRPE